MTQGKNRNAEEEAALKDRIEKKLIQERNARKAQWRTLIRSKQSGMRLLISMASGRFYQVDYCPCQVSAASSFVMINGFMVQCCSSTRAEVEVEMMEEAYDSGQHLYYLSEEDMEKESISE